jgi:hypothetical protein
VVCVCLSETYYITARARTEFTLAHHVSKFVVLLVVDDEGREDSWMNPLMRGRITVDFVIPVAPCAYMDMLLQRAPEPLFPLLQASSYFSMLTARSRTQRSLSPLVLHELKFLVLAIHDS